jgi:uncharacterized membrane protein HdeD (DUF308 family)
METLIHNWWAVALRGVVAILFGIIVLAWPGISLVFLITVWGAFALIDGVFSLVSAMRRAKAGESWGSLVLTGITGILAGLIAWIWPGITAAALAFLIGAWAIITGILEIVAAVQLRKLIRGEFWLGLSGALSVILGILLFLNPAAGAVSLVWLIGIFALIFGITLIALGFRLRSLQHERTVSV